LQDVPKLMLPYQMFSHNGLTFPKAHLAPRVYRAHIYYQNPDLNITGSRTQLSIAIERSNIFNQILYMPYAKYITLKRSFFYQCLLNVFALYLLAFSIPKLIEFATPQTPIYFCSQAFDFTTLTNSRCYILFLISRIYGCKFYNHALAPFVFFIH
jgi:hypothetical protein